MDKIKLPENVRYIIGKLEDAGYEAYAVGGCVRDSLLGRMPEDWDITTSAKPEGSEKGFQKDHRYRNTARNGDGSNAGPQSFGAG